MTIQVGDKVPAIGFQVMTSEGPKPLSSDELFVGKKVAFFAVPGAFTPGCSMTHLPGFVVNADAIKAKGVDTIHHSNHGVRGWPPLTLIGQSPQKAHRLTILV